MPETTNKRTCHVNDHITNECSEFSFRIAKMCEKCPNRQKQVVKVTLEECEWIVKILLERNPNLFNGVIPYSEVLKNAIMVWQGQRGGI